MFEFDGRFSGGGTGIDSARVEGSLVVTDGVGGIHRQGSLSPGGASAAFESAGDLLGHLHVSGDLTLAGGLNGGSVAVERMTLQLSAPTTTLGALGWNGVDSLASWLPANHLDYLTGVQGDLSGHDYVKVGGMMTITLYGTIGLALFGGYTPAGGDLFNLLDWASLTSNGFNSGPTYRFGGETGYDLDLPDISSFDLGWDTSLFVSHGVVVVVPEPGRMALLLLAVGALVLRRRRQVR